MTDSNRLVDLIKQAKQNMKGKEFSCQLEREFFIADYLLANGVMVQKQGEWVSAPIKEKGYDSKTIPTCANCGYQSFITYTFCPECGAKLKEREGK